MSTYWSFECMDHDPPVQSAAEFTQHTDDEHYRRAVELLDSRPVEQFPSDQGFGSTLPNADYFERNAREFLSAHPHCQIDAVSEYGDRRLLAVQGKRSLDADHAVANEREAIAVWLQREAERLDRSGAYYDDVELIRHHATAIRNGDHHANTPPNAQERG